MGKTENYVRNSKLQNYRTANFFPVSATESGPVFTYVVALIKPVHKQADFITANN
eukprot:COSAG02_NODE_70837_length_193_cov_99.234043_1_plen_54_part_10